MSGRDRAYLHIGMIIGSLITIAAYLAIRFLT